MSIPEDGTHQWSINGAHAKRCGGKSWAIWQDNEWILIGDEFSGKMIERQELKHPRLHWFGGSNGLPPIGKMVRIDMEADVECPDFSRYASHIGKEVEIIAYQVCSTGEHVAVYAYNNDGILEYHSLVAKCFKSIRAAEQQSADKRESAIRELMDIAQVDCRVTAARLVDAGFKREVV